MDNRPFVLVVEDEPLIGLLVEEGLIDAGYTTQLVDSAFQAQHELESAAVVLSAMVTDIRLSGKADGWQLARRAREVYPALPIVYMSGDSAIDHSAQGVPDTLRSRANHHSYLDASEQNAPIPSIEQAERS